MRCVATLALLSTGLLAGEGDPRPLRFGLQAGVIEPRGVLGDLQAGRAGGSLGLHALLPVGPVYLRPRADLQLFRGGSPQTLGVKRALWAGLELAGGWKGRPTGLMTSSGVHAVRWGLDSGKGSRDLTRLAWSMGAGWCWGRSSLEFRYLEAGFDQGRTARMLELGVQYRF